MLQAYATVVELEKMGVPYEIILYRKKYTPAFIIKSLPRVLNPILLYEKKLVLQKKLHQKCNKDFARNSAIKDAAFTQFKKGRFKNFAPVCHGYQQLQSDCRKYDACMVGSDQLWSPSGLPTNFYNLQFVPEDIPKISYAASFGVSAIPFYQKNRTKDFLKRIEYLSVREDSAAEIVRELTGRDAKVVVDPTLLLTAEDWAQEISFVPPQNGPYVFAYFLGENPEHRITVAAFAEQVGMKLVVMRHMDQFVAADKTFGDEAPFDVGPEQFLNLIRHAAYICTDSFHGTVFSIMHHKQFVVFSRYSESGQNSRNSRIESICSKLGLSARRYSLDISLAERMKAAIDYDSVDNHLETLRTDAKQFLSEALSCVGRREAGIF